jgi:tetratricopeptide (TPR) repeat protein
VAEAVVEKAVVESPSTEEPEEVVSSAADESEMAEAVVAEAPVESPSAEQPQEVDASAAVEPEMVEAILEAAVSEEQVMKQSLADEPAEVEFPVAEAPEEVEVVAEVQENAQMVLPKFNAEDHSTVVPVGDIPDVAVWKNLGDTCLANGDYDQAISAYRKATMLEPESGWLFSNMGLVYAHLGQYENAIKFYKISVDLFDQAKDKAVALNRLGHAYRKHKDYNNAMQSYQEADALLRVAVAC